MVFQCKLALPSQDGLDQNEDLRLYLNMSSRESIV